MPSQQKAEWTTVKQRLPRRALVKLVTYLIVGVAATYACRVLFSTEPEVLDNGESNPAAQVPTFIGIAATAIVLLVAVSVFRQPRLAINHYGIAVRPGATRTVLLPWMHVEEVTVITVPVRGKGDAYLIFACDDYCGRHSGDRPRFVDRAVLREANRATEGRVSNYDLAVRLADFAETPDAIIDQVAGFAPSHVDVLNQLEADQPVTEPAS